MDTKLNNLRIKFLNSEILPQTFSEFLRNLTKIVFGYEDLIVIRTSNEHAYMTKEGLFNYKKLIEISKLEEEKKVFLWKDESFFIKCPDYLVVLVNRTKCPIIE